MIEAASREFVRLHRISFKGANQALRQWEPCLNQAKISHQEHSRLIALLYDSIGKNIVPFEPH